MRFVITIFLLFFLQNNSAFSSQSDWRKSYGNGAQSKFIASFYEKNGEKKLIAALSFKIADGWKIYGSDSQGIGMPPELDFSSSKNYQNHLIIWPQPKIAEEKIGNQNFQYHYYQGEVALPIEIELKQNVENELLVKVNYGLCKDICIPVSENFSLKITDKIDEETLREIEKFYPQKLLPATVAEVKNDNKNPLLIIMIFALIGGAILNIMPCVLPVLSIKLISVINHLNADISRIRLAFLATISGILSCFLFFSFLAFLIKLTGNSLGWGLQFQNPYFLVFLILILTFFIANLLEIFEISFDQFLATILNKKIAKQESKKNIFIPNFLSGILAVLLATPCSAPFLGLAISFALVQSFAIIFLIFLIIGIGFSLPYIILFISPNLVYLLPKSGSWMKKTKHLMAILLALTAIWLIFILSNNVGNLTALLIAFFSASLLFILKIKSRFARTFVVFLILISSFALLSDAQNSQQNQSLQENEVLWQKFDETEINHLVVSGKVVLIDITADWCITCKFNKIHVLNNKEVTNKIRRGEIVAMRGDITKPNEEIMIFLRKHNRFAIPFNAVYGRSAPQGLLASELLSTHELLTLIEDAR